MAPATSERKCASFSMSWLAYCRMSRTTSNSRVIRTTTMAMPRTIAVRSKVPTTMRWYSAATTPTEAGTASNG